MSGVLEPEDDSAWPDDDPLELTLKRAGRDVRFVRADIHNEVAAELVALKARRVAGGRLDDAIVEIVARHGGECGRCPSCDSHLRALAVEVLEWRAQFA